MPRRGRPTAAGGVLSAMTATVDVMGPGAPRDAATEWLGWCRRYVDDLLEALRPAASHADYPPANVGRAYRAGKCVRPQTGAGKIVIDTRHGS